jgi:hypothetical protein
MTDKVAGPAFRCSRKKLPMGLLHGANKATSRAMALLSKNLHRFLWKQSPGGSASS